jgi:hypothetical protein
MLKTIKQHPMWFFFGLAYLLTWIFWGTEVAEAQGWINFHLPEKLGYWAWPPRRISWPSLPTAGRP